MSDQMSEHRIPELRVVLTDIEGTTTPIAFVHRVLFGYAREALPGLIADHAADPDVAQALSEIRALAPEADPLAQCLAWMEVDAKVTALKQLQGIAWRQGYERGELRSELYDDVPPCLRAWQRAGMRLAVYSSGSEAAQRLVFGHSAHGDLTGLFEAFLDTRIGAKRASGSYREAALRLRAAPGEMLFLSDVEAELDAAQASGMHTCQLVRDADGTAASRRHANEADFPSVAARFGLPGPSLPVPSLPVPSLLLP